jgi:hypothetical protein
VERRSSGNQAAERAALTELGRTELPLSRYQKAADQYEQALGVFRQSGARTGNGPEAAPGSARNCR